MSGGDGLLAASARLTENGGGDGEGSIAHTAAVVDNSKAAPPTSGHATVAPAAADTTSTTTTQPAVSFMYVQFNLIKCRILQFLFRHHVTCPCMWTGTCFSLSTEVLDVSTCCAHTGHGPECAGVSTAAQSDDDEPATDQP